MICSVFVIQCCKSTGHIFSECPKDPNLKTGADLTEEKERLASINLNNHGKSFKNKESDDLEAHERKLKISQMIADDRSSNESFDDVEDNRDHFFSDLMNLKRNSVFRTESVRVIQNKFRISCDLGKSPFMLRKQRTLRKQEKNEEEKIDKVSNLV